MYRNTLENRHLPYTPVRGNNSGCGMVLFDDDKKEILIGKRVDGEKLWCTPGGKIKEYETPNEGIMREVYEESGLRIGNPLFIDVKFGSFEKNGKPWITYIFCGHIESELIRRYLKPQKTEISVWEWVDYDELKNRKLFAPTELALNEWQSFWERY